MYRLAWFTDIHLNFVRIPDPGGVFARYMQREWPSDGVVLTGDISEAPTLHEHLAGFEEGTGLDKPTYFVLGNHDYYHGSFETSQRIAAAHAGWLQNKVVLITEDWALVGNEGWYDAHHGRPYEPKFGMSDWMDIQEFAQLPLSPFWNPRTKKLDRKGRDLLIDICRARSASLALAAEEKLLEAINLRKRVIFATHVPPFEGAAWHEGKLSAPMWIPWFSSKLMGDMLLRVMGQHPEHRLLVLCGHTHSSGICRPLPNLTVITGEAKYRAPDVAGRIILDGPEVQLGLRSLGSFTAIQPFLV